MSVLTMTVSIMSARIWLENVGCLISVVNSVVEYIESLPEGSSTTTFKILSKLYGEESAWNMDPFSLHFEIYDEIERRGKVELDLSEYDGLIVGLPQNYTFVVRKR